MVIKIRNVVRRAVLGTSRPSRCTRPAASSCGSMASGAAGVGGRAGAGRLHDLRDARGAGQARRWRPPGTRSTSRQTSRTRSSRSRPTTTSTSSAPRRTIRHAMPARLTVKPWTVKVDGMVKKPAHYGVEDLVDFKALEERVYRHRCVEAWSMVIPWIGVSLSERDQEARAAAVSQVRRVHDADAAERDAGPARARARVAVRRRPAHGRGDAPAGDDGRRASTARCCRIRTARRCACTCPGSTGSRAASPSCGSGSPTSSR